MLWWFLRSFKSFSLLYPNINFFLLLWNYLLSLKRLTLLESSFSVIGHCALVPTSHRLGKRRRRKTKQNFNCCMESFLARKELKKRYLFTRYLYCYIYTIQPGTTILTCLTKGASQNETDVKWDPRKHTFKKYNFCFYWAISSDFGCKVRKSGHPKKRNKPKTFAHSNKSEKLDFCHFSLITFCMRFLQLFQRIRNQHQMLHFFIPILHFEGKNVLSY
jgi:hypothetical protein